MPILASLVCAPLVAYAVWVIIFVAPNLPHDDIRADITMAEAQSLVIFPICAPSYIPKEANVVPEIIYHADDARVPDVTWIRLLYRSIHNQEDLFVVNERYTRDEEMTTTYAEGRAESNKVILLYWMLPFRLFYESMFEAAQKEAQMEVSVFQNGQTVWGLYEIIAPDKYRSSMTQWKSKHVEYQILSHLPIEEIKKVTMSVFECPGYGP